MDQNNINYIISYKINLHFYPQQDNNIDSFIKYLLIPRVLRDPFFVETNAFTITVIKILTQLITSPGMNNVEQFLNIIQRVRRVIIWVETGIKENISPRYAIFRTNLRAWPHAFHEIYYY